MSKYSLKVHPYSEGKGVVTTTSDGEIIWRLSYIRSPLFSTQGITIFVNIMLMTPSNHFDTPSGVHLFFLGATRKIVTSCQTIYFLQKICNIHLAHWIWIPSNMCRTWKKRLQRNSVGIHRNFGFTFILWASLIPRVKFSDYQITCSTGSISIGLWN